MPRRPTAPHVSGPRPVPLPLPVLLPPPLPAFPPFLSAPLPVCLLPPAALSVSAGVLLVSCIDEDASVDVALEIGSTAAALRLSVLLLRRVAALGGGRGGDRSDRRFALGNTSVEEGIDGHGLLVVETGAAEW